MELAISCSAILDITLDGGPTWQGRCDGEVGDLMVFRGGDGERFSRLLWLVARMTKVRGATAEGDAICWNVEVESRTVVEGR
jgi:hypothetical protein